MNIPNNKTHQSLFERIKYRFIGAPRNINEPSLFHKISLIPILAWIGLGADGLSSSYGPEEAFKALGPHTYFAVFIAIATAFTIFVIAFAYSRIIERFPHGGGYMVSTHTIGRQRWCCLRFRAPGRLYPDDHNFSSCLRRYYFQLPSRSLFTL